MSNHTVVIVGNGKIDREVVSSFKNSYIIACDRAAYIILKEGIVPDVAIGDFDSVSPGEYKEIQEKIAKVEKFPAEKNETDIELAIHCALTLLPKEIIILGGTGGRLDHELSLMFLLEPLVKRGIVPYIIDKSNKITLVDKNIIIERDKKYRYISIIPHTESAKLTLKGFKYNVEKKVFKRSESLGISNEIIEKSAEIIVHSGTFFLIASYDR